MPRRERNALFTGFLATLVLSLFTVTGARSAPRPPEPPAALPDRHTQSAAGTAGESKVTELPGAENRPAGLVTNESPANEDAFFCLTDVEVRWSGGDAGFRGEDCKWQYAHDRIGKDLVLGDCRALSSAGTATSEVALWVSYPTRLQENAPAEFLFQADGSVGWDGTDAEKTTGPLLNTYAYATGEWYDLCNVGERDEYDGGSSGEQSLQVTGGRCAIEGWPGYFFHDVSVTMSAAAYLRYTPYDHSQSYYGRSEATINLEYTRDQDGTQCPTITGQVYVPAPHWASSQTRWPLIDVPVTLTRNGVVLDRAVTRAPDGRFLLSNVPINDNLTLGVSLMHDHPDHPIYQVRYQKLDGPIASVVSTPPFETVSASTPITRDIEFSDNSGVTSDPAIKRDHLDDLGAIYRYTHQAWQLADSLGQELDFPQALDIVAFSNKDNVYWYGPGTWTLAAQPHINITEAKGQSLITDGDSPGNREWHEFGHHVMADALDNQMPFNPNPLEKNHRGYLNPSTTDSWIEGFATFYSMMVARKSGVQAPHLYWVGGWPMPMEPNHRAFNYTNTGRSDEEFAVAGLLWDLVDAVDRRDTTTLGGTTYADCVKVDFDTRLWPLLTTDWGDSVPRSDVAPAGYGHIFDVKHLYDVLKMQGIGDSHDCGGQLTDLDELFVAHGFFADMDTNLVYDQGEEIGRSAWEGDPNRRKRPPPEGSYLAFQAVDDETGAPVPVQDFSVEVRFPPPHEHYSYSFRTNTAQTPGRLLFLAPDAQFQTTTYVTAKGPGYVSKEPLAVTNAFYYEQMASGPSDQFIEHTFDMVPRGGNTYLPMIQRNYGLPPIPPTGWQTILHEGFEAPLSAPWEFDGDPGWGRTDCRPFAGTHSLSAAGNTGGAAGPCPGSYPNNLNTWLVYGPFDLTGAQAAEISFQRWQRTQKDHDEFSWMVSVDSLHYWGLSSSGDTEGWDPVVFDLSNVHNLGDLRGERKVWLAFIFESDGAGSDEGVFVDDLRIRKKVSTSSTGSTGRSETSPMQAEPAATSSPMTTRSR